MASFNEIVSAINSGRAVVKPLPYDPNEEGRMYADYGVYVDGKLVPYSNDFAVIPEKFKVNYDPITGEGVSDFTQPQEIRLRERAGGGFFKDVNMAYDPKTNVVVPPKANQFYTSGSKDFGFNVGGFISDIGSLASSASPVLTAIAGAYFGPIVSEALQVSPTTGSQITNAALNAASGKTPAQILASAATSAIGNVVGDALGSVNIDPAATAGNYTNQMDLASDAANASNAANAVTNATTPLSKLGTTTGVDPYSVNANYGPPTAPGGEGLTGGNTSNLSSMGGGQGVTGVSPTGTVLGATGGVNPYSTLGSNIGTTGLAAGTTSLLGSGAASNAAAAAAAGAGTGSGLSSLLTPTNVLLGKGLLDTLGSNKVVGGINSAAATQQAAYEQSKKDLAALYANQQGYQRPYMATGTNALSNLGALGTGTYQMYDEKGNPTGTGTGSGYLQHQFDASDLAKGLAPNYDFMLAQGQMANQRAANMAGGGFGGNALQGLNRYTQDYAGNAYQNAFTNYQNQRQNIFGNFSSLVGSGQNATKDLTAATGAYGTNLTNLNVGNAAAQAAAQVAAAQQGGTNLSNLGNTAVVASLLNQNPAIAQNPVI